MDQASFNGKYFRTCYSDIRSSKGWFGKMCLLGLISFIPVFGQMTVLGYAFEWGHKTAWGVEEPMPKKIYGRPGSKMLRWGWFALVILLVFAILPGVVNGIGNAISAAGSPAVSYAHGRIVTYSPGSALLGGIGAIVSIIGALGVIFSGVFAWVAIMRVTMYDHLGAGFQFVKIWEMAKRDFGGLMRIFGMYLLFGFVGGTIIVIVASVLWGIFAAATLAPVLYMATGSSYVDPAMATYIVAMIFTMIPLLLVIMYICFVYGAFLLILVGRAIGYWMRQFNVAAWGSKDDPLPESATTRANAQPHPPVMPVAPQPDAPAASEASEPLAPPSGDPVIMADAVEAEATEAEATEAEAEDETEVTEVEVILEAEEPEDAEEAASAEGESPESSETK